MTSAPWENDPLVGDSAGSPAAAPWDSDPVVGSEPPRVAREKEYSATEQFEARKERYRPKAEKMVADDPVYGASMAHASGMQSMFPFVQSVLDPVAAAGTAALGVGDGDSFSERYENARAKAAALEEAAGKAHKVASGVGKGVGLAGSIAALPGPKGTGGLGTQMTQGAAAGAGYGAAYGLEEGHSVGERLGNAGTGAALGAAVGAAAPAVIAGVPAAVRKAGEMTGLSGSEGRADRVVTDALRKDMAAPSGQRMTAAQMQEAEAAGQPVSILDMGGKNVRDIARDARNKSSDAEAALGEAVFPRFESQGPRFNEFVKRIFGTDLSNADTMAALKRSASTANTAAYDLARNAPHAKAIWTPELANLTQSPDVQTAIRGALREANNRSAAAGQQTVQNPFRKNPKTGAWEPRPGVTPDLAFWDLVKRQIDDEASKAYRAGANARGSSMSDLAENLRTHLDTIVPEYATARAGAAAAFGAQDALEAGQKFLGMADTMKVGQMKQAFAKMKPAEKELFAQGLAGQLVQGIGKVGDNRNILLKMNNPDFREKLRMALGPQRASHIETYLQREALMDMARTAVFGNSTTARQQMLDGISHGGGHTLREIVEKAGPMGVGAVAGYGTYQTTGDPAASLSAALIGALAANRTGVNAKVSKKVAEMLSSNDPKVLERLLKAAEKNENIANMLRAATSAAITQGGGTAGQVGAKMNAGDPVPVPGFAGGGAVKKAIRAFHGTPHNFDRFDMSKIGAGEGAQAYGHGLYFAENPDVARGYRNRLSNFALEVQAPSGPMASNDSAEIANSLGLSGRNSYPFQFALDEMRRGKGPDEALASMRYNYEHFEPELLTKAEELLKSVKPRPSGHLYEVDINADPARFADWDKLLVDQPHVIDAIRPDWDAMKELHKGPVAIPGYPDPEARTVGDFILGGSPRGQSEKLGKAGIPGIRYLDGGSRGSGQGTSNYVVFDDKIIDIINKYMKGGAVEGYAEGGLSQADIDSMTHTQSTGSDWYEPVSPKINFMGTPYTLPGKIGPGAASAIETVSDFVLPQTAAFGPAKVVGPALRKGLGTTAGALYGSEPDEANAMFLGRKALKAPLAKLREAEMEAHRLHAEGKFDDAERNRMWDQLGVHVGKDLKPRFEIDDSQSRLDLEALERYARGLPTKLGDALQHPELYENYPTMANMPLIRDRSVTNSDTMRGAYYSPQKSISVRTSMEPDTIWSTLLHEGQHAVQDIEGFTNGASPSVFGNFDELARKADQLEKAREYQFWLAQTGRPNDFKTYMGYADEIRAKGGELPSGVFDIAQKPTADLHRQLDEVRRSQNGIHSAYDAYRRVGGENEAFNVEARRAFTPEQRRNSPPNVTADYGEDRTIMPIRKAAGGTLKKLAGALKDTTKLKDLRKMPVDEAISVARKEPHLIPSGDRSQGLYLGGPRDVQSKRALTNIRREFDGTVASDPRGGDWYDRYRGSVTEVTGGDPQKNLWMSNTHGQFSAGVDPGSETAFSLKENNAAIAGMPTKAARPAQHEAFMRAIEEKDPYRMQLGDKTGEYARRVNPDQPHPPTATGVNDFRHARNFGYTHAGGEGQRDALTKAQHKFLDYETALAVDRANKANLDGRATWTGEQLQAVPWVVQKAEDLMKRRGLSYEDAFREANKTIGDFFDKHTAFATHEAVPGSATGHLPGFVDAGDDARKAYSADPRSSWANAPGGRDAIYGETGIPGTGVSIRTRPTVEMQGMYTTPEGVLETNPGWTARPLVAFDSGKVKSVPDADRSLLDAGESIRGYVDAQNASAWHKPWVGGQPGLSNSAFIPMDRKATIDELLAAQEAGRAHGLGDVVDTGQGLTVTSFYPEPPKMEGKGPLKALAEALPGSDVHRSKVDSGYIDYVPAWQQGYGSGAATDQLLATLDALPPQAREAFNANPLIAQNAGARMARDADYAGEFGPVREDIQNARRVMSEGGAGWADRLRAARQAGVPLPAFALSPLGVLAAREAYRGEGRAEQ
jgi:hypothetical protein